MKATILDTQTGEITHQQGIRAWEYYENGWSCDCNRRPVNEPGSNYCLGCHRYLVLEAEYEPEVDRNAYGDVDWPYSLPALNSGYPRSLLSAHGIIDPDQGRKDV